MSTGTVAKFLPNPENFWGPKQRAKRPLKPSEVDEEKAHNEDVEVAEGEEELPAMQKRAKLLQGRRKKKRPCEKLVQTGHCRFGDRCKFSHDPERIASEAHPTSAIPSSAASADALPAEV